MTFQEVIDKYPPPPDLPIDIVLAGLAGFDRNDDGKLCVLDLPGVRINAIDNVSNVT